MGKVKTEFKWFTIPHRIDSSVFVQFFSIDQTPVNTGKMSQENFF